MLEDLFRSARDSSASALADIEALVSRLRRADPPSMSHAEVQLVLSGVIIAFESFGKSAQQNVQAFDAILDSMHRLAKDDTFAELKVTLARDPDGPLFLYENPPIRDDGGKFFCDVGDCWQIPNEGLFPDIAPGACRAAVVVPSVSD